MAIEADLTLTTLNTAQLLEQQHFRHPDKEAILSKWQGASLTYETLHKSAREIAASLRVMVFVPAIASSC